MKHPRDLTHSQLIELVTVIQVALWFDDAGVWDRDKEWHIGMVEDIAAIMHMFGLRP